MDLSLNDQLWLLVCGSLVLLMQAGFLCLEAGLTRGKNAVNVSIKNVIDLAISPLLFWWVGAAVMFGPSCGGWIGGAGLGEGAIGGPLVAFLFFQMMFCATAATIVSGATAERLRFSGYVVATLAMTGFIYPLIGHWVWGGAWTGTPGWLEGLGFYDFAGSGVVHLTGGAASLAAILAVGPRLGRFDAERFDDGFPKSNYALALAGALILVVGWVGFCGGSTYRLDGRIGPIVLNTMIAGAAGCLMGVVTSRLRTPKVRPEAIVNGLLGGLVAICAGASAVSPEEALLIGGLAGIVAVALDRVLVLARIDDAVSAVPVHAGCGTIGILAVALLADPAVTGQTGSPLERLGVQALGVVVIGVAAFVPMYLVLRFGMPASWLRCTPEEELRGMNWAEHGVESELQVLCRGVDQFLDGSSHGVAARIDTGDEAGALASRYQQMLTGVSREAELAARAEAERAKADEVRKYGLFLHAVLDGMEDCVCILGPQGQIIEANAAWARFADGVGRPEDGAIGSSLSEFCEHSCVYMGGGCEEISSAVARVVAGDAPRFDSEYSAMVRGEWRTIHVRLTPLPGGAGGSVVMTQHDCTEERLAERRLREEKQKADTLASGLETSQQALDLATKGANLGLWHWDVAAGYFEITRAWLEALGHDSADFRSDIDSFRDLLHPEESVYWTEIDAHSVAGDEPYDRQFRVRRSDGRYTWFQALGRAQSLEGNGSPATLAGIVIDIDARKLAELRDAGMAKLIEDSMHEVYVFEPHTLRILEANRGARENLGYTLAELKQKTKHDINGELDRGALELRVAPLYSGEVDRIEVETLHRRKDGTVYPTMITLQRSQVNGRAVLVEFVIDLTQRRALETQLAQAQRLESIGQLAAGVAHEMNTPLQYVSNNIRFLSDCSEQLFEVLRAYEQSLNVEESGLPWQERYQALTEVLERTRFTRIRSELPKALSDSLEGVDRVLEIVRSMREFSHPGGDAKSPTDVNRALSSTATLTRSRWKQWADLELDLAAGLPHVECLAGAMNQVFVNLIVNAADAVAERHRSGGSTGPGRIVVRSRLERDHAVIEVEDNGCGMPEATRRRVFDPFFTTKEVGKGTGQGLSLSHTIVCQNHGGSISVESSPGVGTTFCVRLPLVATPQETTRDARDPNTIRSEPSAATA
ncbi:MAG: ATP-binding protein [Lacipirellulaceae bacterium]